jgi:hypothetical protein
MKDDIKESEKNSLKSIVNNCLGILVSLKQSGQLNLTENRYMKDLGDHIYSENAREFHEINNTLLNLTSKLK